MLHCAVFGSGISAPRQGRFSSRWQGCQMRRAIRAILTAVIGAGLVPATAATNAFAASGATAPPGYQRVRSAPIPIPPGMFDSGGEVACPAGTVPWGGGIGFTGGIPSVGENINTSAPTSNGWRGRYTNSGTQTSDNFAIDAICANQPAGSRQHSGQWTIPRAPS